MKLSPQQPIGIFDSGVGGLTVAHAIKTHLPNEEIIYFGDTFHLPYGDKSKESVIFYSLKISDFLKERNCKVILIACNTASAIAYEQVRDHIRDNALVLNVIDPVVEYIAGSVRNGKIGVIGTKGTINSKAYVKKLHEKNERLNVVSLSTPLLVPMIEEGFIYDDISNAIIRSYLSHDSLKSINLLILGCTHYPIIKRQIEKYYNFNVEVIDSGKMVADSLNKVLCRENLLNTLVEPNHQFFISDFTDYFSRIAKMFFEEDVLLIKADLWK